jgi:hypothetical protein
MFTWFDVCFACACVWAEIVVTTGTVAEELTSVRPFPEVSLIDPGVKPT